MSYGAPRLPVAEVANAIAATGTFTSYQGTEFEIDAADYHKQDGTFTLEGFILDDEDAKHYVQIKVKVKSVEVDDMTYEDDSYDYDNDEDGDDD